MIGIDSNVIVYFEGVDDDHRRDIAQRLIRQFNTEGLVIPVQALGEFHRVAVGKAKWDADRASAIMRRWSGWGRTVATTAAIMQEAAELHTSAGFRIWDAVIVCAAASAGSELLLSEDMHDGFRYGSMTIVNPFATTLHPRLADRLKATS